MLNKVEVSSVLNEVIQIIEKGDGSINLVKMMIKGLKSIVDDDINEENAVKKMVNEKEDEPIVTSDEEIVNNNSDEKIVNNNSENISEPNVVPDTVIGNDTVIDNDTNNVQQNEDNGGTSNDLGQEDVDGGNSIEDVINTSDTLEDSVNVVEKNDNISETGGNEDSSKDDDLDESMANNNENINVPNTDNNEIHEVNSVQADPVVKKDDGSKVVKMMNMYGGGPGNNWTGNVKEVNAKLLGGTIVVN